MERYQVVERYADNGAFSHWALVDTTDGRELGSDGGEPEDQVLVRDLAWVPHELNRLAADAQATIAALQAERAKVKTLERVTQEDVDTIAQLREQTRVLREALQRISTEHCVYSETDSSMYSIGATDGHRCAANIAKAALTATSQEGQS